MYVYYGSGYYVVFSGIAVLESTTGSCMRKCWGRVFGTITGGLFGWAIFWLLSNQETTIQAAWFPYSVWLVSLVYAVPWCLLRVRYTSFHYFCQYTVATGLMIFHSGYYHEGRTSVIVLSRIAAVATGVLLNACVVTWVLPNSARLRFRETFADMLRRLASVLGRTPDCVVLKAHVDHNVAAATVSSPNSGASAVSKPLKRPGIPRRRTSGNETRSFSTSRLTPVSSGDAATPADRNSDGRLTLWLATSAKDLQACYQLLMAEEELIKAGRHELRCGRPHVLRPDNVAAVYEELRCLYLHIAAYIDLYRVQHLMNGGEDDTMAAHRTLEDVLKSGSARCGEAAVRAAVYSLQKRVETPHASFHQDQQKGPGCFSEIKDSVMFPVSFPRHDVPTEINDGDLSCHVQRIQARTCEHVLGTAVQCLWKNVACALYHIAAFVESPSNASLCLAQQNLTELDMHVQALAPLDHQGACLQGDGVGTMTRLQSLGRGVDSEGYDRLEQTTRRLTVCVISFHSIVLTVSQRSCACA